jgi:hypothetical protein
MAASEAAAMPFPKEETTPPVMNMYFVMVRDDTVKRTSLKVSMIIVRISTDFSRGALQEIQRESYYL